MSPKWEREEKVGVPEGCVDRGKYRDEWTAKIFDADMIEYVPSICGDHHCNNNSISSIQALPRIEKEGAPHVEGKTVIHVIG